MTSLNSQQPELAQQRKNDHLAQALKQHANGYKSYSDFDKIRFIHHSCHEQGLDQVDLSTYWAGHSHQYPLYINAMTGGSQTTAQYNEQLGRLAQVTGLAIASGSVSAALKDPTVTPSFQILRKMNPQGFILANIGAHHSVDNAKRACDLLEADALQIHLNIPQEVVMPEGDRSFAGWLKNIEAINQQIDLPVIVKETGFGMGQRTLAQLKDCGVSTVDLGGRSGTNFVQIESERHVDPAVDYHLLSNWGQTTAESLLESIAYQDQLEILASGGIRHYYDAFKALALGAKAVGIAGPVISHLHLHGLDQTIQWLGNWLTGLRSCYLLAGTGDLQALQSSELVLTGSLSHWAHARQLDLSNRHSLYY